MLGEWAGGLLVAGGRVLLTSWLIMLFISFMDCVRVSTRLSIRSTLSVGVIEVFCSNSVRQTSQQKRKFPGRDLFIPVLQFSKLL